MGEKTNACRVLVGKSQGKRHLDDIGVDDRTVLQWILNRAGRLL